MNILEPASFNRDEFIQVAKHDLDAFALMCIPDVYEFAFPPIFKAIWQLLTENAEKPVGQDKLAIGIPRGFGKTILLKLFTAWLVAFTDRKFVLIVCNTAGLAENFIADVLDILSSNNFIRVFGDYRNTLQKDTQGLQKFHFKGRPVIIAGLGSGSSLRGLNLKFVRPDVITMDDMQSREEAASETESKKNIEWMLSTLMKANNKRRCLFTFVGNMYPYEGSILKKLKHNPAWISFICGAILADGESIWPELRSVEDILDELENDMSMGHPEIFYSEVMNDEEAGARAGVDISKINYWELEDGPEQAQAGFVMIDPSLGRKKSDDVALGAFFIFDSKPVLWKLEVGKFNPKECVVISLKMAMTLNLPAIVVEAVAYQATLAFWIDFFRRQLGIKGLKILEVSPPPGNKNSRIISALKLLTTPTRDLMLNRSVKSQVIHQVINWDPLKANNKDDILDLFTYVHIIIKLHAHAITRAIEMDLDSGASFSDSLEIGF
jgi:hypothetical protein